MRKFLIGLFLAVAIPSLAWAGMNLRQDNDSGATWVHGPSGYTYSVGRQVLNANIVSISTAASSYLYVPEAGVVTAIYCTMAGAITGNDSVIAVGLQAAAGTAATSTFTSMTIAVSGSAPGIVDSSTGLSTVVAAGNIIELGTDGESTGASVGHCQVIIDSNS